MFKCNRVLSAIVLITSCFLIHLPSLYAFSIPPYISYQGRLTQQSTGAPINQTKSVTFSLYDTETGGTAIYKQTLHVNITNGSFSLYLGKGEGLFHGNIITDGIPPDVFTDHSAWYLGIKIEDSNAEMTSRQLIASSAYAYQAEKANEAEHIMGQVIVDPNSGNVGIGTAVPSEKLEVTGAVKADYFMGSGSGITELGNLATESILNALKGHLKGLRISYVSPNEISVDGGVVHINNGIVDAVLSLDSRIVKKLTGLSHDTWYYIYLSMPYSGLSITASDITFDSLIPSYDHGKKGWYHADSRCIGCVLTDENANIRQFDWDHSSNYYCFDELIRTASINSVYSYQVVDLQGSVPNFGKMTVVLYLDVGGGEVNPPGHSYAIVYLRNDGSSNGANHYIGSNIDGAPGSHGTFSTTQLITDSEQKIQWRLHQGASPSASMHTVGFYLTL